MTTRKQLVILWFLISFSVVVFCVGLVALMLLQPDLVGIVWVDQLTETATREQPTRLAAARTATAVDLLAVRNFEFERTLEQRETEVVATITQSAADVYGTATQLAETQQANVDSAYGNIVIQATLENELLIAQINATAISIESQATLQYVAEQATQAGVWFANTEAAIQVQQVTLDARESGIIQRETQTAVSVYATQTETSFRNNLQGTQSALDFESTRQAVNAQATQVELDFRGTEAALSRDATAVALGGAGGNSGGDNISGTPDASLFMTDGAAEIINGGLWTLDNAANWRINADDALVAQVDAAALTTPISGDYTLRVAFVPATGTYTLQADSRTAVLLIYDQTALRGVQVYRDGVLLTDSPLNSPYGEIVNAQLTMIDTWLYLTVDSMLILNTNIGARVEDGTAGIAFPAGAVIEGLQVE